MIQVLTSSKAKEQKAYVIQFLNEHYFHSTELNIQWNENVTGWRFCNEEKTWEISADFFHDLDTHWLSSKFLPIPLRNGLAHPNNPEEIELLGTIFYLLSHYSECLQPEKDVHNRVSAQHALVVEKNWHNRCVVNECAEIFLAALQSQFPGLTWKIPEVNFRITHDVDRPYKYAFEKWTTHFKRGLGSFRFGNSIKNIIKEVGRLFLYPFLKDKVDPFNQFEWIIKENNHFRSIPYFYWIPLQSHREFDSLYNMRDERMKKLLSYLHAQNAKLGCHPNYNSGDTIDGIKENWAEFSQISPKQTARYNRQHFLKFNPLNFPEQLELSQVEEDSSYGWADRTGFRASTSLPYYLFDVKNKKASKIREIPLCVMDVTVFTPRYMNITAPPLVLNQFTQYLEIVKKHGGVFCVLWHNDTLQYSQYKHVYWKVIKLASNAGKCI